MVKPVLPRFNGTFKLESPAYGPSADLSAPGKPINQNTLVIDYGGRRLGYVSTVEKLAKTVEKDLPDNVLVTLAIGHWGGSSAYDNVSIRVLSPDKKKALAEDRFYRSINEYDGLDLGMFVPKFIRDTLFRLRILSRAKALLSSFTQDPEKVQAAKPAYKDDDSGDYTGLW